MEKWLSPYQLTQARAPLLDEANGEVLLQFESTLSIYFGDTKKFRKGECTLTNFRILWTDGKMIRHSLSLKYIATATTKSGFVGMSSPKIILNLNAREIVKMNKQTGQPTISLQKPPKPGYMMLSFHSSSRDAYLAKLKKAVKAKAWVKQVVEEKRQFSTKGAGIRGLIAENKKKQAQQKKIVSEAFEDLESLMVHARQMVALANRLAASNEAKEQASEFDNMLQGMGIISPVTKSAAGSQYHTLLARQLVDFLIKPLKRCGGMMTLTDIYCLYNKARGTQLVSPQDIFQACSLLNSMDLQMKMKRFSTGVMVLQLNEFNEENQRKKILDLIEKKCKNGIDELRLSQLMNISVNLSREQLLNAERDGYLCRDDSIEGLKFYENVFVNYDSLRYWKNVKRLNILINDTSNVEKYQSKYEKHQKVMMDL